MTLNKVLSAKEASSKLALLDSDTKNNILAAIAGAIEKNKEEILFHNEIDMEAAKEAKVPPALLDRLFLSESRIDDMIKNIEQLIKAEDPIGAEIEKFNPTVNNISVKKIRVPLGVIAVIYEARPNVSVDTAVLCIKSGNAVILKGGSEAMNSNKNLIKIVVDAAQEAGLPKGAIQFIDTADRAAIKELIALDGLIDLLIPRGGDELVKYVRTNSIIPVLSHGKGLCHLYIDKSADIKKAIKIAVNSKCQRAAVCNAVETLLVHKDVAKEFIPLICKEFWQNNTLIKGDEAVQILAGDIKIQKAEEIDWQTEYHDLIISIKVVNSLHEAIAHINKYGSKHTDAIVSEDKDAASIFLSEVDSAAVMINASTRLHDGGVFGFGGEIGTSTQKFHARGTMGAKELTTTKYIVVGDGAIKQ
ncbi:MAG: glutamate-5-semialdehyde dehydrogenase [Elusimicrobiota bacterium]|nr:glutamate-5-semialdehyde dehydrogenase [Elusimicrobiota bacterium]